MVRSVGVGAEIQTIGGIIGRIVGSEDDLIKLEVSPGVVMTFVRAAIARIIEAPPSDDLTDEGFGGPAGDSVPDSWSSNPEVGGHDAPTEPGEGEAG
jgi:preprotein translocase subunit YajC